MTIGKSPGNGASYLTFYVASWHHSRLLAKCGKNITYIDAELFPGATSVRR